jgi:proteasome lid subunit RPN8/RPN11
MGVARSVTACRFKKVRFIIMNIRQDVYLELLHNCPPAPPETGGILGGQKNVITTIAFDVIDALDCGTYTPNVTNLNTVIASWSENNIDFMGVFHSHCPSGAALSKRDRKYIEQIMLAMPREMTRLYFPLIIPGDRIIPYVARRNPQEQAKEVVTIEKDEIFLAGIEIAKGGE